MMEPGPARPITDDGYGLLDGIPWIASGIALLPNLYFLSLLLFYLFSGSSSDQISTLQGAALWWGLPAAIGLAVRSRSFGPWRGLRTAVWMQLALLILFWAM